jgi:uncharacterized protein (TIGR03435 family)
MQAFYKFRRVFSLLLAAIAASGQQNGSQLEFEAASVKQAVAGSASSVRFLAGGHFQAHNSTLLAIMEQAYDVSEFRIAYGPGPASRLMESRFDIDAAAPAGSASPDQVRDMLQNLLASRFSLRVRHESRTIPIYALTPNKNGLHLSSVSSEEKSGSSPKFDFNPAGGYLVARNVHMAELARILEKWLDRPIADHSGFTEPFDITLSWTPGPENIHGISPAPAANDLRPSIFSALTAAGGLRLSAERDAIDVIVIDHAESPSLN